MRRRTEQAKMAIDENARLVVPMDQKEPDKNSMFEKDALRKVSSL